VFAHSATAAVPAVIDAEQVVEIEMWMQRYAGPKRTAPADSLPVARQS